MKKKLFLLIGFVLIILIAVVFFIYRHKESQRYFPFDGPTSVLIFADSGVEKDYLEEFIGLEYNPKLHSKNKLDLANQENAVDFIFYIDDLGSCDRSFSLDLSLKKKSQEDNLIYYTNVDDPSCYN